MAAPLKAQREALILQAVRQQGAARVSELAEALAVSEMTIRRDIDDLASRGLCLKVHGGASRVEGLAREPGFEAKSHANTTAKRAIARAAARLVQPGQAVAISAGTTTVWVAAELAPRAAAEALTIVTNSLPAAETLARAGATDQTILTGGVRTPSQALVGPLADAAVRSMRFDWFFLGVHGMDADAGFTTPNVAEAATNRAFINSARATAVTADASKWAVAALSQIAPLASASRVFSDESLPPQAARRLRRATELTLVRVP
ncbi:MAG: DeoR/GlpR family DNA-binding transcription regulator [Bifidobacteriaceae bacterium]|jgi:DeoR/GlpR family transcriptional regulator of sugar metabolism|nr:DeoR/GlpR family DNA-binding transcription regulator [Bifidobacteriaceae bacterium]